MFYWLNNRLFLYSPIPKEFLESIGGGSWIAGGEVFGTGSKTQGTTKGAILNNVIGVGPYFLEEWVGDQEIVFKRNDNWFEYVNTKGTDNPRYRIEGVHFQVISAAQQRDDAIYDEFNLKHLDQTSIPVSRMSERKPTDDQTKGDATFKLNVNSCDQTRWDDLFWSTKYPDVENALEKIKLIQTMFDSSIYINLILDMIRLKKVIFNQQQLKLFESIHFTSEEIKNYLNKLLSCKDVPPDKFINQEIQRNQGKKNNKLTENMISILKEQNNI